MHAHKNSLTHTRTQANGHTQTHTPAALPPPCHWEDHLPGRRPSHRTSSWQTRRGASHAGCVAKRCKAGSIVRKSTRMNLGSNVGGLADTQWGEWLAGPQSCMAHNLFHKWAAGSVVSGRMKLGRLADTLCGKIFWQKQMHLHTHTHSHKHTHSHTHASTHKDVPTHIHGSSCSSRKKCTKTTARWARPHTLIHTHTRTDRHV
jgi:hypothetical protein